MTGKVWMSSVISNSALGDKPGVRTKYFGHDWQPAEFKIPLAPDDVYKNMRKAADGFALPREELPEAAAVWNVNRFRHFGDIFYAGGFLVVRGSLAETLARFDLGDGGLVAFPIFKADLATPYPGEFFLLNFGCRKNTIIKELSENITVRGIDKASGIELLRVRARSKDGDLTLSEVALTGPDMWVEERVDNKLFLSDALAEAIAEIGMRDIFELEECRIVEGAR